jgi:16S rRNA (guanine966-N2)-methyltransferase
MTRIIAGQAKGRRLAAPHGSKTRPTASRVKQTLFDLLAPAIAGCRFLDLFAGSGAVGIEALSRGAGEAVFVEHDRHAASIIRRNAQLALGAGAHVNVRPLDFRQALKALAQEARRFDAVFIDPPYESDLYEIALGQLGEGGLLTEEATVAVEHFHKRPLPERIGGLVRERTVRVGDHVLSLYRLGG